MNREIKFRVWNGECMISPDYITRDGGAHWKENSIPTCTKEVMQYTGLKDRNGVGIYENDIINLGDWGIGAGNIGISKIIWDSEEVGFRCDPSHGIEDMYDLRRAIQAGEIIGNIYSNPELLK